MALRDLFKRKKPKKEAKEPEKVKEPKMYEIDLGHDLDGNPREFRLGNNKLRGIFETNNLNLFRDVCYRLSCTKEGERRQMNTKKPKSYKFDLKREKTTVLLKG